jgi:Winged helix DNA-binding domain
LSVECHDATVWVESRRQPGVVEDLLRGAPLPVVDAVRRVVALQAQEPASPYVTLRNRVDRIGAAVLDVAFTDDSVVKATPTGTVHGTQRIYFTMSGAGWCAWTMCHIERAILAASTTGSRSSSTRVSSASWKPAPVPPPGTVGRGRESPVEGRDRCRWRWRISTCAQTKGQPITTPLWPERR